MNREIYESFKFTGYQFLHAMSLTKLELQKILRKYRLNVVGNRPDLVSRLKEHLSTVEEYEAEAEADTERLDILEAQLNELRIEQEEQARILEKIRDKVIDDSPPPSDDETSRQHSSSSPSTGNDFMNNNNNNTPPVKTETESEEDI